VINRNICQYYIISIIIICSSSSGGIFFFLFLVAKEENLVAKKNTCQLMNLAKSIKEKRRLIDEGKLEAEREVEDHHK